MTERDPVGATRYPITTLGAEHADDPQQGNMRHEAASDARAIGGH